MKFIESKFVEYTFKVFLILITAPIWITVVLISIGINFAKHILEE